MTAGGPVAEEWATSGAHPFLQTSLLDAVQQAVIATNADRHITYWNPFAERLYGWTAGEVLGRDITEVVPTNANDGKEKLALVERGDTWSGEFQVRRKNGEVFPAFVTVSPIKDSRGRSMGAMGVSFDVSEQKQRDLNYDALFQAMSEGVAFCEAIRDDAQHLVDYTILEINPALRSMLGVGPEAVGAKLSDSGPPNKRWLKVCDGVLQTGEPANFEYHNRQTGRWHEIRISRAAGNCLAQFFFDITERKTVEAELLANQSYLRLILDAAADAFYCLDREGSTTHCNAAFLRLLGFEDERAVIGRKLHEVIHHSHPDGAPYDRSDCPIYRTAQTGEPVHVNDELFFRLDGSSFPVEYWVQPIKRDDALQGAICTFRDISARRAAEEAQGLLLREMNHRVKNLFAVVNGVVSLSARSARDPVQMGEAIRGRLDAMARAHELILPTTSAGGTGRKRRTDLASLAKAVLSAYADGPTAQGDERLSIAGSHIAIDDRAANALALVLNELATNAVKHGALSQARGQVRIAWSTSGDRLELSWEERGGPVVAGRPAQEGFGSVLARRSVAGQLAGEILHDWRPGGLAVKITAPLEHLVSP